MGQSSSVADKDKKIQKVKLASTFQHQLRCDRCLNYLSVGPVMISANRKTLCGRCTPAIKGVSLTNSLYNVVAQYCYFLCINHYEGCKAVLGFQETKVHEARCKGKDYSCLFCPYKAKNGSQIAWHCDKYHPENVIKDHTFELPSEGIGKSTELIYFNVSNLLSFKISVNDSCVKIAAHYLNDLSKNRRCCIVFQNNEYSLSFDVELIEYGKEEKYLSVSIEKLKPLFSDLHDILCKVNLGNEKVTDLELKTKEPILRRRLTKIEKRMEKTRGTTSETPEVVSDNPTNYMIAAKKNNELLKTRYLKDGHKTCTKCGQEITAGIVFFCFDSSYCENCFKTDGVSYAETDHLNSTIHCPCEQTSTVLDCGEHKRVCGRREYECVACPQSFTFEQLRMHWHAEHPLVLNSPLMLTQNTLDLYWAVSGELFQVHFVWKTGTTFYVKVEAVDVYKDYNYDIYFNYEEWFGEEWVNKSLKLKMCAKPRTWTGSGLAWVFYENFQLTLAEVPTV